MDGTPTKLARVASLVVSFILLLAVGILFRKLADIPQQATSNTASPLESTSVGDGASEELGGIQEEITEDVGEPSEVATSTHPVISSSPRVVPLPTSSVSREKPAPPNPPKVQKPRSPALNFPVLETPFPPVSEEKPIAVPLPLIDDAELLQAIVRVECLNVAGTGKYVGSGFVISNNRVITAAHVVMNASGEECNVVFPRDRRPIVYVKAHVEQKSTLRDKHDKEGIDVAVLSLPLITNTPSVGEALGSAYPAIQYPICRDPNILGDVLYHYGYPSNFAGNNYLQFVKGSAAIYADVKGITEQLSQDQAYTFKTPLFDLQYDAARFHTYLVSRVGTFYGDSGGLTLDASKRCIVGPSRGSTIGASSGENYTILSVLGATGPYE